MKNKRCVLSNSEIVVGLLDVFTIDKSYNEVSYFSAKIYPRSGVWNCNSSVEELDWIFYISVHIAEVK